MLNAYRSKPDWWLAELYNKHTTSVREKVPPERLLEFNVKDGWVLLCDFLGVPIPDVPFPNVNDSSVFVQLRRAWLLITYTWIPLGVVVCWNASCLLRRIAKLLMMLLLSPREKKKKKKKKQSKSE